MNKTKLSPKRAREIALLFLQYRYSRRGLELRTEIMEQKYASLAKKIGRDAGEIKSFFFTWIITAVLRACDPPKNSRGWTNFDEPIDVSTASETDLNLALRLATLETVPIIGLHGQLENIASWTKIEIDELQIFYWTEMAPRQLAAELGALRTIELLKFGPPEDFNLTTS